MWRLIAHQLYFFWNINRNRFIFFMILFGLFVGGVVVQTAGNPHLRILTVMLGGTVGNDMVGQTVFPTGWFITLLLPVLALGDSIPQLWRQQGVQIWGTGFTRRQFALVDVILIVTYAISYWLIVCSALLVVQLPRKVWFLAILLPIMIFMLLIETWLSWLNQYVGVAFIIIWLVLTVYTILPFNPLNLTMLIRESSVQFISILMMNGNFLLVIVLYVGCFPNLIEKWSE